MSGKRAATTTRGKSVLESISWICRRKSAARDARIRFTFYWRDAERWECRDFGVIIDRGRGIATAVAARDSGNDRSRGANTPPFQLTMRLYDWRV
jgi:hypothetical protein